MMTGKRDMIAPWKMLRSRLPSVMAARMASLWDSEMFTYPQRGSLSLAESHSWPPRTFKTTPSPEGRSFWGAARERTSG